MATVDRSLVPTVPPAEYSRVTGWYPFGKRANGRAGLGRFIVAGSLVSKRKDMMVPVVQTMAHPVLNVMMSF